MRTSLTLLIVFILPTLLGQSSLDTVLLEQLKQSADNHWYSGNYQKALELRMQQLDLVQTSYGENHAATADVYVRLCSICIEAKLLKKAKTYCEKALAVYDRIGDNTSKRYADAISEFGLVFHELGDEDEAINYCQKSLALYLENFKTYRIDSTQLSYFYYNIGNSYLDKKEDDKALSYFFQALRIDQSVENNEKNIADDLDNIATVYKDQGNFEKALDYYQQALTLYKQSVGRNNDYTAYVMKLMAECLLDMGKPASAIALLNEAMKIDLRLLGPKHSDISKLNNILAKCYAQLKQFDQALAYHKASLQVLGVNLTQPEISLAQVDAPLNVVLAIGEMGITQFQQFEQTRDIQHLEAAKASFSQVFRFVDVIRAAYREKGSKVNLLRELLPYYDYAIRVCLNLYASTSDKGLLEEIFQLMESSRSVLLLENQQKNKAEQFAGIPAELLEKEIAIAEEIAVLEKSLYSAKSGNNQQVESLIHRLNSQIFDKKESYKQLVGRFETDYPDYYRLKYDTKIPSIRQVQDNLLSENQGLIEYFVGKDYVYVLFLNKSDIRVQAIAKDFPLSKWIEEFRNSIYGYHTAGNAAQNDKQYTANLTDFTKLGYQLYQKLIEPLDIINTRLIIVPDGVIGYLPFDALLTDSLTPHQKFNTYPYLLKKHQISYTYSVTLLQEMQQRALMGNKKLLAFAPNFEAINNEDLAQQRGNGLAPLRYNLAEATLAQKLMGGKLFKGTYATKHNFVEYAPAYSILHLSTHGKANDKVGDASFLAFTAIKDSTNSNDVLFVRELYNLRLNAELVVLSACETGIGELQQGEGIVSLARGFSYAGAKSILTTLWSVDDAQSKVLIELFYRNLKKGKSKDSALHQAKLDYLAENPMARTHPFYWSSYVLIGDVQPYQVSSIGKYFILLGVVLALVLFFLVFLKKR